VATVALQMAVFLDNALLKGVLIEEKILSYFHLNHACSTKRIQTNIRNTLAHSSEMKHNTMDKKK